MHAKLSHGLTANNNSTPRIFEIIPPSIILALAMMLWVLNFRKFVSQNEYHQDIPAISAVDA